MFSAKQINVLTEQMVFIYSVMLQQEPGMSFSWKSIWRKVLTQCFTFVPGYIGIDVWTQVKYGTFWEFCNHWEGWRVT